MIKSTTTEPTHQQVSEERGNNYGDFNQQFALAQRMKNMVSSNISDPVLKECMDMILTKISRLACGNEMHYDSWFDAVSYTHLTLPTILLV